MVNLTLILERTRGFQVAGHFRFTRLSSKPGSLGCIIDGIAATGGCMLRPIFAVLGSFVVLTNLLAAQASKLQSAENPQQSTSDTSTFIDLIQQSHDLDHLLPSPMSVWLLTRQTDMISHSNPDLGREWANELFASSLQL